MNIKTQDLTGPALDWAVAKCEGAGIEFDDPHDPWLTRDGIADQPLHSYTPSSDWSEGGPIIEREEIFLAKSILGGWTGSIMTHDERVRCTMHGGLTPLIAAMRCFVASKLGEEVEIPEELK
jgi:hypothetical protein